MPPTIPQFKTASVNTSASQPNKPKFNKKNNLLLVGIAILILIMVGGIVAISLTLQQKPISEKAKAYTSDYFREKCGINFVSITESPNCDALTSRTNINDIINSKKNDVSKYVVTYTLRNTTQNTLKVEYSKNSNYCIEPYGQPGTGGVVGCWSNEVKTSHTIDIVKESEAQITIEVSSTSGAACGSYQTDLVIEKVNDDSNCFFSSLQDPTGFSVCQTGNTCTQPTTPPTIPPTTIPTVVPTVIPTSVPTTRPTISPTIVLTVPPNSTATPIPPTARPNATATPVPTSPPNSTATPQPTSSTCIQKVPNVPQGVGIEIINNNQCKFSWNEVSNITGYQVSWGENPNGEGKPNANLGKVLTYTFDCPDLAIKTYYFKVRAMNECAEGTFSNIVHAGSWPTPTEIILAKTTSSPTKTVTPSIPSAGIAQFGFLLIPLGIILMALIL